MKNLSPKIGYDFNAYLFAELYMAVGGIPHYLKELDATQSNAQNIDRIFFSRDGLLSDEFDRLYPALFERADNHILVIRTLAGHVNGLNRTSLIQKSRLSDGGSLNRVLEELEFSGFIKSYYSFGKKKKGKIFRLVDEYSLFYLRFVERNKIEGKGVWTTMSQSQSYKSWRGYAFENLGLKHIDQIKSALGIAGVSTTTSTFYRRATEDHSGLQIDLVIERADKAINLCEFKFYNDEITLNSQQIGRLREVKKLFLQLTRTNSVVYNTMISPYGIKASSNKGGVVNQSVTLDELFK